MLNKKTREVTDLLSGIRKTMWWFVAATSFTGLCVVAIDMILFSFGGEYMLTADVQEYFGGSAVSFRSAMGGFVVGALLTHFTRWGSGDK